MRHSLILAAVLTVVTFSASEGLAQCPFPHPARAKSYKASLVQAFVGCRTYPDSCCSQANAETEGGIPSCKPAQTFNDLSGTPSDGWIWGPKSSGSVALKALDGDLGIALQLSDVRDGMGLTTADGQLVFVVRVTLDDPTLGGTTLVDFPFGMPVSVVNGKAKLKTTLSARVPEHPVLAVLTAPCRSIEIVYIGVRDANANFFADAGIYFP